MLRLAKCIVLFYEVDGFLHEEYQESYSLWKAHQFSMNRNATAEQDALRVKVAEEEHQDAV